MKGKAIALLILSVGYLIFNVEIPKRAFRFYDKGDLDKTVEALEKSLEKDTLNPAANYLYSKLYTDTAFWGYHVDTAYLYINEAIYDFGFVVEEKDLGNLEDVGVDSLSLELQKDLIDSLQFELITARHTIADYNWFMQVHADALQVPEAIRLRNHIAFEDAERLNTWQSYLAFMQEYPQAEGFTSAEDQYKKLIFDERTADGKLNSYTSFLEEFPGTPYREIAEQQIFEIGTATHRLEDYTHFLKNYPNSGIAKIILPRLYHLYKDQFGTEGFSEYFDLPSIADSLNTVMALEDGYWMPKLENDKFRFFNQAGENIPGISVEGIDKTYLCGPIQTDFVVALEPNGAKLIGRNGALMYEGVFDQATDLGWGLISLADSRGVRLIHKSGEVIVAEPHESISMATQHFIKTQKDGRYGLTTINGKQILAHEYDEIDTLLSYLWIEKAGKIGLIMPETLFPAIDGESVSFELPYEEIELQDNGLLWVIKDDQEGILTPDLRPVVPFDNHSIYDREYGYQLEKEGKRKLLHRAYPFLNDKLFDRLIENTQWIAAKTDSSWTLIDRLGKLPMAEGYDSLQFLGENMVMLYQGEEVTAQFRNGKQMLMQKNWQPSLLVPQNYIKTGEPALHDFFMLTGAKNYRKIYNSKGREILTATYKEVVAMGPNLLKLQKRNTALADSTGNYILKFIYDGVGSYDRGYVSILKSGKVGILNIAKGLTIPPTYESLITPYSDTVLMAREDGLIGFINDQNTQLSGFDFDEVKYWNDSVALVRIEEEWLLHHIADEEAVYDGITAYEYLTDSPEEKRLLVTRETGKGIYSSLTGELIEPTYDDIKVLGTEANPIYFAVKIVAEANIYVVIYFDKDGNKLFTLTYQQDEYFDIACSDK